MGKVWTAHQIKALNDFTWADVAVGDLIITPFSDVPRQIMCIRHTLREVKVYYFLEFAPMRIGGWYL